MSGDERLDADLVAGEYVLGTLNERERAAVETLIHSRPELRRELEVWEARLAPLATQDAVAPSPDLWARIEAGLEGLPQQGASLLRAADRRWHDFLPGIAIQVLRSNEEDGTQTFLLRFAPGAYLPPHDHPHTEECYVLDGELRIDAATFGPGDYLAYPAGLPHHAITTAVGATVLLRGNYG